jgi:glycosyltransferase involved in cell wall biosynthesis
MKVAMIYGNPVGEFYGGISTHVNYLIKYLSNAKDIDLVIITFGQNNRAYIKNGVKYIELKRMKFGIFFYPLEILYDVLRIEREIKKIKPDIIHIQSTSPNLSLFGIHSKKKYPMVLTVHGYFAQEYKIQTGWRKIVYKLFCAPIEKLALQTIPNIIVLTPQMEALINKITTSKIQIISNGIDLQFIQTITPYEKKDQCPTIFFLGYLTKGKGVENLIKAVHLVKKEKENIKLYIGGVGPYETILNELVGKLDLQENVTFLGFLNEEKKFTYMKAFDIFVLPSYWESFPMVLLEAMACGKPIITTDVGGNPYAVTDKVNGFLVQPDSPQDIAEHLVYLINNQDLLKKMGQESKKRSLDFDWEIIARQTRECYKGILKN